MWSAMLFSQFPVVFRCFIIIVKLHNGKQAKLPGSLQTSSIPFSMQNELIGSRGQFLIWCNFPCCENKLALTHMSFYSVLEQQNILPYCSPTLYWLHSVSWGLMFGLVKIWIGISPQTLLHSCTCLPLLYIVPEMFEFMKAQFACAVTLEKKHH